MSAATTCRYDDQYYTPNRRSSYYTGSEGDQTDSGSTCSLSPPAYNNMISQSSGVNTLCTRQRMLQKGQPMVSPKKKKSKSTYKHVPHCEKAPHLVARRNARERRRVMAVNNAFTRLRRHVPCENRNKRISKVKTLKIAIDYIYYLQDLIEEHDHQTMLEDQMRTQINQRTSGNYVSPPQSAQNSSGGRNDINSYYGNSLYNGVPCRQSEPHEYTKDNACMYSSNYVSRPLGNKHGSLFLSFFI